MTQRSGTPRARAAQHTPAPGRDWWRAAAAGLALIVVMAAIRGPAPRIALSGAAGGQLRVAGGVLEAVLAILLAALLIAGRRAAAEVQPAARLRGWLRGVLLLGLLIIPVLMLLSIQIRTHPRPRPAATPPSPPARSRATPQPLHTGWFIRTEVIVIYALVAAALLAAAIAAGRALWRYWPRRAPVPAAAPHPPADAAELSRAVDSGQAALRRVGEARAAIIACYVAMEQSLARAGTARADAETPDELLARAAAGGVVRGSAAGRLTGLFYDARFSSHPVPPASKQAAEQALAELAAELAGRSPAADGVQAPGQAQPGGGAGQ